MCLTKICANLTSKTEAFLTIFAKNLRYEWNYRNHRQTKRREIDII